MKRIIIIGASSGIGKEMALRYAQQGHKVGITGRRCHLLEEVKSRYPENIVTSCFDVTGTENKKLVQQLIEALGGLDLLVYNSGFGDPSEELRWESEMLTAQTNVTGCVDIASFAFTFFVQQGYGQLAFTSSVSALRGNSWAPAYSASKAFISNYAEGLNMKARRWSKAIYVTDIRPGFINTKPAKGNKRFWVTTPQEAVRQIMQAIAQRKRVAYVTRRWWFIGQLLKILPFWLYRRLA